jgi:ABC-type lipoprotein release transport system permease subunit
VGGVGVGALLALGAAKAVAGALANLAPARRASAVDPSGALRSE